MCNITPEQYELFVLLSNEKEFVSIQYLCEEYGLERTGVQKKLSVLLRTGLVYLRQKNLVRGYSYIYCSSICTKEGMESFRKRIVTFLETIKKEIN
jgi:predicted transcriptional regulator